MGYSLGAHLAGIIARVIGNGTELIGRVTGILFTWSKIYEEKLPWCPVIHPP